MKNKNYSYGGRPNLLDYRQVEIVGTGDGGHKHSYKMEVEKFFEWANFANTDWYFFTSEMRPVIEELRDARGTRGTRDASGGNADDGGSTVVEEKISIFLNCLKKCNKCHTKVANMEDRSSKRVTFLMREKLKKETLACLVMDHPRLQSASDSFFGREKELLLLKMIRELKLSREDIEIVFAVKCPPKDELDLIAMKYMANQCAPYLWSEITMFKPKIIITFGSLVYKSVLQNGEKLSEVQGKFFPKKFTVNDQEILSVICPFLNLEYLLLHPQVQSKFWEKIKKVEEYLGKSV